MKQSALLFTAALAWSGCVEVAGPEGPPGNANIRTVTIAFAPSDATRNGTVVSRGYNLRELVPSVVDRGAVFVYFRDQRTWTALPYTLGIENPDVVAVDYTFTIGYAYDDALLEIFIEASSATDLVWDEIVALLPAEYLMKVVIIDGFSAAQDAGIDPADYEAIEAFYSLDMR